MGPNPGLSTANPPTTVHFSSAPHLLTVLLEDRFLVRRLHTPQKALGMLGLCLLLFFVAILMHSLHIKPPSGTAITQAHSILRGTEKGRGKSSEGSQER